MPTAPWRDSTSSRPATKPRTLASDGRLSISIELCRGTACSTSAQTRQKKTKCKKESKRLPLRPEAQRRAFGSSALACGVAFRRLSKPPIFPSGEQNGLPYHFAPICPLSDAKGRSCKIPCTEQYWEMDKLCNRYHDLRCSVFVADAQRTSFCHPCLWLRPVVAHCRRSV